MTSRSTAFLAFLFLISCSIHSIITPAVLHSSYAAPTTTAEGVLAVVIMVKDEEHVMKDTLKPFLDGGVDTFFIFDTGSTDRTVEVARDLMVAYGIKRYCIAQEAFVDFSTSRNRGLDLAEQAFPDCEFMIMPDAEWYMVDTPGLINFCKEHKGNILRTKNEYVPNVYLIRIDGQTYNYYATVLFRVRGGGRFFGVVHETAYHTGHKVPDAIYLNRPYTTFKGYEKSKNRWSRDKVLLQREHERNPTCNRTLFYLAQTLDCLGEHMEAYKHYVKRFHMKGWQEEQFVSAIRAASLADRMAKEENPPFGWEVALNLYLEALNCFPGRGPEALMPLAHHYIGLGQHQLSYLFANRATELQLTPDAGLFIERDPYEYTRYDVVGQSAWYVAEYEKGEEAVRNALKSRPDFGHLKSNLSIYQARKEMIDRDLHQKREAAELQDRLKNQVALAQPGADFSQIFNPDFMLMMGDVQLNQHEYRWNIIKALYEKHAVRDVQVSDQPRIPYRIHHIWLGSELPEEYRQLRETWKKNHPHWEMFLWTDKEVEELGLQNIEAYRKAKNWGEKSDIVRYEVLYRYGGVYSDTDVKCFKPFDILHHVCDFYGCAAGEGNICIINCLIGCSQGNPLMKKFIDNLGKSYPELIDNDEAKGTFARTGPWHLTKCFLDDIGTYKGRALILPSLYFFPWSHFKRHETDAAKIHEGVRPESFAIHYWNISWNKGKVDWN